jgi:hypothetical protein
VYAKAFTIPSSHTALPERAPKKKGGVIMIAALVLLAGGAGAWRLSSKDNSSASQLAAGAPVVVDKAAAKNAEEEAFRKRQADERERELLDKAAKDLERLHGRWKDASALAGSTARIALATPVASLQAIRRETVEMVVPECLDHSKEALLQGMNKEIEGYMTFMQDANLGKLLAQSLFTEASDAFGKFTFRMKDACPKG